MLKNTEALEVVELPLEMIEPNNRNPRDHGEKQLAMLGKSINKHGFNNPPLVGPADPETGKYELVARHARLLAAERLGMKTVPAIILSHLDATSGALTRWPTMPLP